MCLDVFLFQSVWSRRLLHVSMHGNSAKGPSPQTRRSSTGIAMCHREIIPGWYLYEYIMDIYIYIKGWFLYDISWKWNISMNIYHENGIAINIPFMISISWDTHVKNHGFSKTLWVFIDWWDLREITTIITGCSCHVVKPNISSSRNI